MGTAALSRCLKLFSQRSPTLAESRDPLLIAACLLGGLGLPGPRSLGFKARQAAVDQIQRRPLRLQSFRG